jgi:hypothetical protein
MSAEYDRAAVSELLMAMLAYQYKNPYGGLSPNGEVANPQKLFNCREEHKTHQAKYRGTSGLNSDNGQSFEDIELLKFFRDIREQCSLTDEELDQIEMDARRAEIFIRKNFARFMHHTLLFLIEASILHVERNPVSAEEFRQLQERLMFNLRELLPRPEDGRPKGSGLFSSNEEFIEALQDVLKEFNKKPSQRIILEKLRKHPLAHKTRKVPSTGDTTKTLRTWYKECGITHEVALERYWKPAKAGQ